MSGKSTQSERALPVACGSERNAPCSQTRTSQGDDPRVQGLPADQVPLPKGWEERRTGSGLLYFIDHLNKRSTYIDPRTGQSSISLCALVYVLYSYFMRYL